MHYHTGCATLPDLGMRFSDTDAARAHLIRDLKTDFGVNDEGVDVVLHLVDQLLAQGASAIARRSSRNSTLGSNPSLKLRSKMIRESIMTEKIASLAHGEVDVLILQALVRKLIEKGVLSPDDVKALLFEAVTHLDLVGSDLTPQAAQIIVQEDLLPAFLGS